MILTKEAIKTKRCSKCKKVKSITEFYLIKIRNKYTTYHSYCKDCRNKYQKSYKKYRKSSLYISVKNTEKRKYTKYCPGCKQWKSKSEFNKSINVKDGLHTYCRKCTKINHLKYKKRNKENWIKWFIELYGKNPICPICKNKLEWNNGHKKMIQFDHRNKKSKTLISSQPSHYYKSRTFDKKNKKVWLECDFGILCYICNKKLPLKNRNIIVQNTVKYVFGEDYMIVKKPQTKEL